MLTSSSIKQPRLTSPTLGLGVPNRMSEMSVAHIEPPQPSDEHGAHRGGQDVAGVLVVAHVRAVQDLDDLTVDPRGATPCSFQIAWRFGGATER